jgi:asparagine synthase (glutamine-hydrolysing)
MCGIAGIYKNHEPVRLEEIKGMTDSVAHRGPDGEGHWINSAATVALGHRRLSIIDLSNDGAQPMHFSNGRYTITFNGEIYNYVEIREQLIKQGVTFKSKSDTEVLLALYALKRERCLQELDGMFSFAIWDDEEKKLFCARDRFGEKPFYYHYTPGKIFVFGSEMKELFAYGIPRDLNERMLYNFLLNRHMMDDPREPYKTFFKNVHRLEPAHYLYLDKDLQLTKQKYWDIDLSLVNHSISFDEAVNKFRERMYSSINRRLRSDVPVGSSLSGGLDSSTVVCAINKLNINSTIRQKTFSARFPGFEKDEGYYMQKVIDITNVEPFFTFPSEESFVKDFKKMCFHQEEPFAGASVSAQWEVMRLARQNNVTVLLDGQGADEILAGYHQYTLTYLRELHRTGSSLYQSELNAYREKHSPTFKGFDNKGAPLKNVPAPTLKDQLKNVIRPIYRRIFPLPASAPPAKATDFLNKDFVAAFEEKEILPTHFDGGLREQLYINTRVIGLHDLLRFADRNSMAFSREIRLPFLSHELVEFIFTLPNEYKINNGWTKYVMRKAFEDVLPPEIAWRTDKIGYEPPQKKWMANPMMKDILAESLSSLENHGIINKNRTVTGADDEWTALTVANTLFA